MALDAALLSLGAPTPKEELPRMRRAIFVLVASLCGLGLIVLSPWISQSGFNAQQAQLNYPEEKKQATALLPTESKHMRPIFGDQRVGEHSAASVMNTTGLELTRLGCRIPPSKITQYCAANTPDKALAATNDCSQWFYYSGALDNGQMLMDYCANRGLHCHIADRGGNACFTCSVQDFSRSYGAQHWQRYCAMNSPKQWYMTQNCNGARYVPSLQKPSNCQGCYLYDRDGMRCPCQGRADMRCHIQACMQYEADWCWATSVAVVAGYYSPDRYPNGDASGPNCDGLECMIVGGKLSPSNPGLCCQNKHACYTGKGGTGTDIILALRRYTGRSWSFLRPLQITEALFVRVLNDGNPIIMGVSWREGSGHVMVLAGTDNRGTYYLHDPQDTASRGGFLSLSWAALIYYSPLYPGNAHPLHGTINQAYVPSSYVPR